MKIILAQTNIIWEDKLKNRENYKKLIRQSSYLGARLIAFPEMCLTGFSMNINKIAEKVIFKDGDFYSETIDFFKVQADKYNINIAFGMSEFTNNLEKDIDKSEKVAENKYYIVSSKGKVIFNYTKIHPFSFLNEDKYYIGGNKVTECIIDDFVISALICYDLRFPELFQRCSQNCDLILVPANWSMPRTEQFKVLLKARAIENQCYIAGINRIGKVNEFIYDGASEVFDPYGKSCSYDLKGDDNNSNLIVADINVDIVRKYRNEFKVKNDRKIPLWNGVL